MDKSEIRFATEAALLERYGELIDVMADSERSNLNAVLEFEEIVAALEALDNGRAHVARQLAHEGAA